MPAIDRRAVLRAIALLPVAAGGGALLASCGASSPDGGAPTAPRQGGTLRAAFLGAGAAETLNPYQGGTILDYSRARAIHGTLGDLDPTAPEGVRYHLLERIDNAPDYSAYTLRVRSGARFSDGSPVTAADVVHSLQLAAKEAAGSFGGFLADFRFDSATAVDDRTVQVPTARPITDGRTCLCFGLLFVVKAGTAEFTATMPTSGPFTMAEYEAGTGARLVRNDGYVSSSPGPFLDGVELRSIADADARLNALRGGQVDFANDLSPVQASLLNGSGIELFETSAPYLTCLDFKLNVAARPFGDVRVRQAFKYAVDRQQMLDNALSGRGVVGNDLYGIGFPDYATEIEQRPHDPARARALLAEAGADGVPVTLTTGPETPGMVEASTLFVEQLRDVGVQAELATLPAGQLFADFAAYTQLPFTIKYSMGFPAVLAYQMNLAGSSPFTFGWSRPDIDAQIGAARTEPDQQAARTALVAAQRALWEEGNQIIPVFRTSLDAYVPGVTGIDKALFAQCPNFAEVSL